MGADRNASWLRIPAAEIASLASGVRVVFSIFFCWLNVRRLRLMSMQELDKDVATASQHIQLILNMVGRRMVGQRQVIERLLMGRQSYETG